MRAIASLRLPALILALALLATAACGGAAPPRSASGAPTGAGAQPGGSGGSGGSGGTAAPKPAAGHPWQGSAAWGALAKLGNYAYRSTVVTASGGQNSTVTVEARYHSPTDYELTIAVGGQKPARLIRADNGHRYLVQPGQGAPLDLGAGSQSPYGAMFQVYESEATGPWTGLFGGSHGTYAGPCTVLGRLGSAFRVGGASPALAGAVTGARESFSGTACLDARTGAPLRASFQWQLGASGKTLTYSDRMQLTAVGTVPPIPPPSGAKAFPGVPGGTPGGVPGGAPGQGAGGSH
jgi:hypothetical protein